MLLRCLGYNLEYLVLKKYVVSAVHFLNLYFTAPVSGCFPSRWVSFCAAVGLFPVQAGIFLRRCARVGLLSVQAGVFLLHLARVGLLSVQAGVFLRRCARVVCRYVRYEDILLSLLVIPAGKGLLPVCDRNILNFQDKSVVPDLLKCLGSYLYRWPLALDYHLWNESSSLAIGLFVLGIAYDIAPEPDIAEAYLSLTHHHVQRPAPLLVEIADKLLADILFRGECHSLSPQRVKNLFHRPETNAVQR